MTNTTTSSLGLAPECSLCEGALEQNTQIEVGDFDNEYNELRWAHIDCIQEDKDLLRKMVLGEMGESDQPLAEHSTFLDDIEGDENPLINNEGDEHPEWLSMPSLPGRFRVRPLSPKEVVEQMGKHAEEMKKNSSTPEDDHDDTDLELDDGVEIDIEDPHETDGNE